MFNLDAAVDQLNNWKKYFPRIHVSKIKRHLYLHLNLLFAALLCAQMQS